MMIVLLAEHALMNVPLKQYQRATSIKLMRMFALTVVLVLMFAPLRQFILPSIPILKKQKAVPQDTAFLIFNFWFHQIGRSEIKP
jgi:hypothetical protein